MCELTMWARMTDHLICFRNTSGLPKEYHSLKQSSQTSAKRKPYVTKYCLKHFFLTVYPKIIVERELNARFAVCM